MNACPQKFRGPGMESYGTKKSAKATPSASGKMFHLMARINIGNAFSLVWLDLQTTHKASNHQPKFQESSRGSSFQHKEFNPFSFFLSRHSRSLFLLSYFSPISKSQDPAVSKSPISLVYTVTMAQNRHW